MIRITAARVMLAFTFAALPLMGCVRLAGLTTPPPTRTGDLDDEHETIRLSAGVGLAFDCRYQTFLENEPCPAVSTATTDDQRIARAYRAHVDELLPEWRRRGHQTGFVIVGVSPGTTVLRLRFGTTEDEYEVTVDK